MKFKKKNPNNVGWFDLVITLTPMAWVFACSVGAFDLLLSGSYLLGIGDFIAAFVFVFLLVGLGMSLTGTCISFYPSTYNRAEDVGRVKVFLIELVVLLAFTCLICFK